MNLFSKLFRSRDKPKNFTTTMRASGIFGQGVNARSAMQMTAVYACVRMLAESIASLPLHVYHYSKQGGSEKAVDHPLYTILHDAPNLEMTSYIFRETLMTHLLLWGNTYVQIIRDKNGDVSSLWPLMPDRMTVTRGKDGSLHYLYHQESTGEFFDLKRQDVLHVPGLGFDGLIGYAPIEMAKNAISTALSCEEYGAKFFENGAQPGGVLEHPGTIKDPERLRQSWQQTFGGAKNSGRIAVLEEGMKYSPIAISPEQAQFLETRINEG